MAAPAEVAPANLSEFRLNGANAVAALFRSLADSDSWKGREMVEGAYAVWINAMKSNPLTDLPGEIVLAMRVISLLVGLASVTSAQADAVKAILKYAEEP